MFKKLSTAKLIRRASTVINVYFIIGGLILLILIPIAFSYSHASTFLELVFNIIVLLFTLFLSILFMLQGICTSRKKKKISP